MVLRHMLATPRTIVVQSVERLPVEIHTLRPLRNTGCSTFKNPSNRSGSGRNCVLDREGGVVSWPFVSRQKQWPTCSLHLRS